MSMPGFWEVLLIVFVLTMIFKRERLPEYGTAIGGFFHNCWSAARGRRHGSDASGK